jgi:hypothetical protein
MSDYSNGFERHNIDHLSASSINLWANAPDVWVMQYLHGLRTPMGAAAWRGICTEDAVVQILMGESETAAIDQALAKFDKRFPIGDEKTTAERARIKPMVQLAIEELIEFGKPEFPEVEEGENNQEKISITAKGDGWSIPVIGYLDLVFPQHGVVIDLKTTGRIPSTMSAEHQLQRAIYAKAKGNMAVKFLYVSEKKTLMREDGDPTELLAQAKVQISRIEAFLRHCDKDTAKAIVPVQPSSFYWSGNEDLRKQFYGI